MAQPIGRSSIRRRTLLGAAGGFVLSAPALRAHAQTAGVALVIGNSKYQWEAQLPNVRRDAPDIAKRFQAMGLKTELVQDMGRDAMLQRVEKFAASARGANLAALYFAGHGAYWDRRTYLVPVDADLSDPALVQTFQSTRAVTDVLAEASNRLLVFDACRNNPADGWQQVQAQRSAVVSVGKDTRLPPNSLSMFSTAPGRVALDGPAGQNSPFAAALMRQLDGQSVELQTLASKLRRDLLIATEGRQVLFDQSSYQSAVMLRGARLPDAPNRSGWAGDPSKIVELPNSYAYARDNQFTLPEGLIAHRPVNPSSDARMIGAFKYTDRYRSVGSQPGMIVVISVDQGSTAEVILAGRSEQGQFWRFSTATLSGGQLRFIPRDNAPTVTYTWRDANSGTFAHTSERGNQANQQPYSTTFTRLDG